MGGTMPTLRELSDIADYLAIQLKEKEANMPKKCTKCEEPLNRIFYRIVHLRGDYCRKCAHDMYRELGFAYYAVDRDDDET